MRSSGQERRLGMPSQMPRQGAPGAATSSSAWFEEVHRTRTKQGANHFVSRFSFAKRALPVATEKNSHLLRRLLDEEPVLAAERALLAVARVEPVSIVAPAQLRLLPSRGRRLRRHPSALPPRSRFCKFKAFDALAEFPAASSQGRVHFARCRQIHQLFVKTEISVGNFGGGFDVPAVVDDFTTLEKRLYAEWCWCWCWFSFSRATSQP